MKVVLQTLKYLFRFLGYSPIFPQQEERDEAGCPDDDGLPMRVNETFPEDWREIALD